MYDRVMAEPGDLVPTWNRRLRRTEWVMVTPERCPNGHALAYPNVSLSWTGCSCIDERGGGHHVAFCLTKGCGGQVVFPPCVDETQRAR